MKSRQAKEDDGKKEFRLVRIKNPEGFPAAAATVGADLGIFIARSPQLEVGCPGYYVAHILQDGIVKRFARKLSDCERGVTLGSHVTHSCNFIFERPPG